MNLSDGYQVIGDIALLSLPPEMEGYKNKAAWAVLSQGKNIRTVLNKVSRVEGDRRVAGFEILAGNGTVTTHREFGFFYRLDVARVFFNSRLGFERHRVACQVRPGERVLVPFSGVGPFAVPLAARGARTVALEKSSEACRWLAENARLNRVQERLAIINADALRIPWMLKQEFDRAVIPAPYGMDHILGTVSAVVKSGGLLHFYTFKRPQQIEGLVEEYEDLGFRVQFHRRCGNVAPIPSAVPPPLRQRGAGCEPLVV